MRTKAWGFTLIELMAALAILALVLLIGMPAFTTFLRNSEIRSTSESIINGLRTASAEATRQNAKVVFTLAGGASWTINLVKDTDVGDCTDLAQPPIQQYSSTEAGKSTKITTTPTDKNSVCFNGLGRILNQGTAGDHLQRIDINSIVCAEARQLRVIVDDPNAGDPTKPRGLRMCDPDPALATLNDPRACRDDIPPNC